MDRYRIIVTTVGAVVGVVMVLIFSFVAAESLLMWLLPGTKPAQEAAGSGVASLHESSSSASDSSTPHDAAGSHFYVAEVGVSEAGGLQANPPQYQQGLLTTIIGSDVVVQTTGAVEQIVETLTPIQIELRADQLLEQLQGHLPIQNETISSLLSPVL